MKVGNKWNRRLPLTRSSSKNNIAKKQKSSRAIELSLLSPRARNVRKIQDRVAQDAAFKELLVLRGANGGKNKHGDIQTIVTRYKNSGQFVDRCHLEYRMQKNSSLVSPKKLFTDDGNNNTVVSESPASRSSNENIPEQEQSEDRENLPKRKGGRKKGSTNKAKRKHSQSVRTALTKAAARCIEAKCSAKAAGKQIPRGTWIRIIKETESKFELDTDTLFYETVKSRVLANNASGICHQKVSPVAAAEDLIVDSLCRLSKMGEALIKSEVLELADDILRDTIHAENLVEFCNKRKIDKDVSDGRVVGNRWYTNFFNRHSERIKRGKCTIQDVKRSTWCTKENFQNMYDSVYEAMVEAGVAIKHDSEIMLDREGKITLNPDEMYGRKTRYQLIKPERCVYVDETGCNTNMICDKK